MTYAQCVEAMALTLAPVIAIPLYVLWCLFLVGVAHRILRRVISAEDEADG